MSRRRRRLRRNRYRWLLPLQPFGLFLERPPFHRGGFVPTLPAVYDPGYVLPPAQAKRLGP